MASGTRLDFTLRSPENDDICRRFVQFMLQPFRGEEALRAEAHHENQRQAEEHEVPAADLQDAADVTDLGFRMGLSPKVPAAVKTGKEAKPIKAAPPDIDSVRSFGYRLRT